MVEVFRHEHATRNLICKIIPVWSTGVRGGGSGGESGTTRRLRPTQAVSAAATVPLAPAPQMGHRPFGAPQRDAVEADASGRPAEPRDNGQWIHGRPPPTPATPPACGHPCAGPPTADRRPPTADRRPSIPAAGSAADPRRRAGGRRGDAVLGQGIQLGLELLAQVRASRVPDADVRARGVRVGRGRGAGPPRLPRAPVGRGRHPQELGEPGRLGEPAGVVGAGDGAAARAARRAGLGAATGAGMALDFRPRPLGKALESPSWARILSQTFLRRGRLASLRENGF